MIAQQAVGVTLLTLTWLVCGGCLLLLRVLPAGALLVAAGSALAAWLLLGGPTGGPRPLVVLVALVLAPLATVLYPRRDLRGPPADRVATAAVLLMGGAASITSRPHLPYLAVAVVAAVGLHLWWRLERLDARGRRPLVWLGLGLGATAVLAFSAAFALPSSPQVETLLLAACGLPSVAMVVGVRRPDVLDATGIVVEAVSVAVAVLACVALYVTVASGLTVVGGTAPEVGVQAVLAAVAAIAFHPVRASLRSGTGELLFGRRPDPVAAVARASSLAGDAGALLDQIREALALPWATVRVAGATDAPPAGDGPMTSVRSFPLLPGTSTGPGAGDLVVGLRPGELQLPREDAEVLSIVARLLGQTLRAEALTAEVTASRAAIRTAVEEERRRLRRELHDGLGPTLAGIAMSADAAANLAGRDDARTVALLRSLREASAGAIDDVRRIAYAMRPPALDQVGLRGALAQVGADLAAAGVELALEVPEDLGELPAAVEVAAYRVVREAMTNAARHGAARQLRVVLARTPSGVRLRVLDDGPPGAGPWRAGVGIGSMRERAEELGGWLRAGPTSEGGLVEALLPTVPVLRRPRQGPSRQPADRVTWDG